MLKTAETEELSLNREQKEAETAPADRPCLVIAGPGAGKTAVIAARCRHLVRDCGVQPQEILVLTFTRAAASEMQARFRALTGGKFPGVCFGTFHAVFYRAAAERYGFRAENLIAEGEKQKILQEILKKHYPEAAKDQGAMEALLAGFQTLRSSESGRKTEAPGEVSEEKEKALLSLYTAELRRRRKIDYDDILLLTREMLQNDPAVQKKLRGRYRYILVDEYQDVSPVQAEILRLLAAPANRIFAVGDDDQAIYRFRGASPEIMLHFPRDFPGGKTVHLRKNYRSSPEIVKASLQLISHNKNRYRKQLVSARDRSGSVIISRFPSEREEYRTLSEELFSALSSGGELSETAVLFRTNAAVSPFAAALLSKGVPFALRDRIPDPFHHFACLTLLAVLDYVQGDHSRAVFLRFMNCPPRFIRRTDLLSPIVELSELQAFYEKDPDRSWMAQKIALLAYQTGMLQKLRIPYAMVNYIRKGMELDDYFKEYAEKTGLSWESIEEALDYLQDSAREFSSLRDWYAFMAKCSRELAARPEDEDPKGRVMLSTIHRAKGLQYEKVILMNVCEKSIPHARAESAQEIEEERRLLYVGMTRAKTELRLCVPKSLSGRRTEESRFLTEIQNSCEAER